MVLGDSLTAGLGVVAETQSYPALLQEKLKAVFDPKGLLNPGKIFAVRGHRAC